MEKRIKKSRYITGIDGIRSVAVIGVIFYHLIPTSIRGGYLGVPVFFVISGYLITDLLRQEWQQNGKIQLKQFYIRRLKRLYPALATLLIVSSAYITLFQRNLLNNLRGIVTSSLLYLNNWWQIRNELSYFDRFGNESPFTHLWSLAVEGQNYLIWPLLFLLLIRVTKKRQTTFLVIAAGALVSAILMAILFVPGADPTRAYYGTDTRIFSIWIGGSLAFIWPSKQLKEKIPLEAKRVLNSAGLLALVLLVISFVYLDGHSTFVYYGGMYLISLLAAVLVAITAHPGASLNRWLTNPVFTYLGKRSYGIYLYQFPVMIFYESKVQNIADNVWLHIVIELALILIASELSYRFVEKPLRNFDYSQSFNVMKKWLTTPNVSLQKIGVIFGILVFLLAGFGMITAPVNYVADDKKVFQQEIEINKELAEQTQNNQLAENPDAAGETETTASEEETLDEESLAIIEKYGLTEEQFQAAKTMEITAFGDSVMLGATIELQEIFPQAVVDADISRQLYTAPELLQSLREQGLLKDKVVLALGTNGSFTDAQFDSVMKTIGDRQVYVVNVRVPTQRWQNEVNLSFEKMVEKYPNITLIDWYSESNEHDDWFREDHVHLEESGKVHYATLLAKAILN